MPFIMDGEGFMLFASGEAKSVYDGLADSVKEGVRHHPDVLRLHAQQVQSQAESGKILHDECTSYVASSTDRSLSDLSDQELIREHFQDNFDGAKLQELLEELKHRTSSVARIFELRVRERLKALAADDQVAASSDLGSGVVKPEPVVEISSSVDLPEHAVRPLEGVSDHGLSRYFNKDVNNRENLELLLAELGYRSSSIAKWLTSRVEEQLESLSVNQVAIIEPVVESGSAELSLYRPFKNKKFDELEAVYWQAIDNIRTMEQLYEELRYRFNHGTRNINLRNRVRERLSVLKNNEPVDVAKASAHEGVVSPSEAVEQVNIQQQQVFRPLSGKTIQELESQYWQANNNNETMTQLYE